MPRRFDAAFAYAAIYYYAIEPLLMNIADADAVIDIITPFHFDFHSFIYAIYCYYYYAMLIAYMLLPLHC